MFMKKTIVALVLGTCALSSVPVLAFDTANAATAAATAAAPAPAFDLAQDVNRVLKTFDVPGIAIAIVKDGKVVAAQGFGVRKLGDPAPVTAQHAVRDRLELEGLHCRGTGEAGRPGQAGLGRPGHQAPAGLSHA
jgi:hypothetical protein